ncbi:MAG: S41 family peptidase [Planctomycetes bacterium]|nr:S41 family peptidase [Planctomycetota bacterium]NOG55797.1 S41 family peptidase [Planctomycetota bacterium]
MNDRLLQALQNSHLISRDSTRWGHRSQAHRRRQAGRFSVAMACVIGTIASFGMTHSAFALPGPQQDRTQNVSQTADDTPALWLDALEGRQGMVVSLLESLAENAASNGLVTDTSDELQAQAAALLTFLDEQAASRKEQLDKALQDLAEHVEAGDLSEALADAIAAHELCLDAEPQEVLALTHPDDIQTMDSLLNSREVRRLTAKAETAAVRAEESGDLLESQDLFYRLNLLYAKDRRYREDAKRVSRRVALLRFYRPERLIELVNERRIARDLEPRPAYEDEQETWQQQLSRVDETMVALAMNAAAKEHLEQRGWIPMILGGLEGLETFLTTADVYDVFPGLDNEDNRTRFIEYLKKERQNWQTGRGASIRVSSELMRDIARLAEQELHVPSQVIYHEFGQGAMGTLDEFSGLIWPYEMDMFNRQLRGSFTGVGIKINLDEAYRLTIVTPLLGSPAHRAGIKAADRIVAVDGKSTVGITLDRAIDQITGPAGTNVMLSIEREGYEKPLDFDVTRGRIIIDTIRGWRRDGNDWDYMIDRDAGIGYIRCLQFLPDTVVDFNQAINQLRQEGLNGLILDLRYNPGGLLSQAEDMSNRFVESGALVHTEDSRKNIVTTRAKPRMAADLNDIPVAVLINNGSASASEIVSGCLRDHERAVLVGTRTHGKGSVQAVLRVGTSARMRLTTQHYLLPKGEEIHRENNSSHWGVDPHVVVRMTTEQIADSLRLREAADLVLNSIDGREAATPQPPDTTGNDGDDETAIAEVDQDEQGTPSGLDPRDPDRLLVEPIDLQLQMALLALRSRVTELHGPMLVSEPHSVPSERSTPHISRKDGAEDNN